MSAGRGAGGGEVWEMSTGREGGHGQGDRHLGGREREQSGGGGRGFYASLAAMQFQGGFRRVCNICCLAHNTRVSHRS